MVLNKEVTEHELDSTSSSAINNNNNNNNIMENRNSLTVDMSASPDGDPLLKPVNIYFNISGSLSAAGSEAPIPTPDTQTPATTETTDDNVINQKNKDKDKDSTLHASDNYQIPIPKFVKKNEQLLSVYQRVVPRFPQSIKGRINPVTLVFKQRNHNNHIDDDELGAQQPRQDSCVIRCSTAQSANNARKTLQLQSHTSPHSIDSSDPVLDELITEGEFERYFNLVSHYNIRILVVAALILQILTSVLNYMKEGNYVFGRDFHYTFQLGVTVVLVFILIPFPLAISYSECVYLQILLLTNNIPRLIYKDPFPLYEPSYQMFLWLNYSIPTAKFWRSTLTGAIGIVALVAIRLAKDFRPFIDVFLSMGGSYLFYLISSGFGARLFEISNRSLFVEIVQSFPALPAHKTYQVIHKFYRGCSSRISLRFNDREMERRFIEFYSSESVIELGMVLASCATTIFYAMQDYIFSSPDKLYIFLILRFVVVLPTTLATLYFSILRKTHPYRADMYSVVAYIILVAVQCIMFSLMPTREGALYYFGGVMRVLSLAVSQLFFLYMLVLLPFGCAILPLSIIDKNRSANTNYILFFVIFINVIALYSLVREKTQRLRFLVRYYVQDMLTSETVSDLLAKEVVGDDTEQASTTTKNNNAVDGIEMATATPGQLADSDVTQSSVGMPEHSSAQSLSLTSSQQQNRSKRNLLHYSQQSSESNKSLASIPPA
ncbi:hypothetical protein SAMD00019534_113400 [Acytostelium subglobosum LB1]|uniref:hypothetical protein n=1 Tax=Acytostelium subglobosum LB1 TaxID=1410327 RepID=UPI000644856C|nr:hypothetical protein SAMD00019534_113400 [Acytostelium subglobosum LB1]GAM28164.1 hypothetical protein SAMD00019534_113400 [Acytostelium subglobosum LB1]|eukprot:XP_012748798.1 hypothetical protein SAMD00019534_113400 [Acytostelium subglobosum LB1]